MHTLPLCNLEFAQRLIRAERDCYVDWVQAMDVSFGTAVQEFGSATAIVCSRAPAAVWNRVFNLTPADLDQLPAILDFYRARAIEPIFDLSPYTTPPYWEAPHMTKVLATRYGLYQVAFHQMLYGVPSHEVPPTPAHISIREVHRTDLDDFKWTYEQVWDSGTEIVGLVDHPNFRCYLAYIEDKPAALGVVHLKDGVASMAIALTVPAMRGKGCQTALLYQRIKQAADASCNLLVSQCMPGVISQINQLRVGFQLAGTKTWWTPLVNNLDQVGARKRCQATRGKEVKGKLTS
jgi:hypothetical protein